MGRMMQTMKKWLAIFLALTLAVVPVACDGDDEEAEVTPTPAGQVTPTQSPTPTPTPAPTPPPTPAPKPTATPTATPGSSQVRTGEWTAQTEFGEMRFSVSPDARRITELEWVFSGDYKCEYGGESISGETLTVRFNKPPLLQIVNGQFTWEQRPPPNPEKYHSMTGSFDRAGTRASGTWEMGYGDVICSGTWEAS
jgi:hypothetical protein